MPPDARFDPQSVLIDWKDARGFTVADAQTGVAVFGATGSGKTSGPGQLLARAYLHESMGGLVLCAKPSELAQWQAWARATGRCRRARQVQFHRLARGQRRRSRLCD